LIVPRIPLIMNAGCVTDIKDVRSMAPVPHPHPPVTQVMKRNSREGKPRVC